MRITSQFSSLIVLVESIAVNDKFQIFGCYSNRPSILLGTYSSTKICQNVILDITKYFRTSKQAVPIFEMPKYR